MEILANSRIVFTTETGVNSELNEETLKLLTGGDKVDHRGLFTKNVAITPIANAFLLTNYLPKFNSGDNANLDRDIVIRFTEQFSINHGFEEELNKHLSHLFTYIMQFGRFSPNEYNLSNAMKVERDLHADVNEKDLLKDFITEQYIITGVVEDCIDSTIFLKNFINYCNQISSKFTDISKKALTIKLKSGYKLGTRESNAKTLYTGIKERSENQWE